VLRREPERKRVFGGESRRGGRVGDGEGGELELRCGRGTERSEAPAASPNRQARGGEQEREMGGGGRLGATWRKENGRERAWRKENGTKRGPRVRWSAAQTAGLGWLQAARLEVAVHTHGGGGLANMGGWQGAGDAVRRG
jgi:hypothetical protein